jgi:putative transposase
MSIRRTVEIRTELIDELLKDYQKPEDIIGENGLLRRFVKAVLERAMNAELTHHLGYEKHDPVGADSGEGNRPFRSDVDNYRAQQSRQFLS